MLFFHPWRICNIASNPRQFRIANNYIAGYQFNLVVRVEVVQKDGDCFVSGYNLLRAGIDMTRFPFTKNIDEQKNLVDAELIRRGHALCASEADAQKFELLQ